MSSKGVYITTQKSACSGHRITSYCLTTHDTSKIGNENWKVGDEGEDTEMESSVEK
jgi:hypothetical protein